MSDAAGSIIGNKKPQGLSAGAHLAFNRENARIKKPEENPLSNANLPGGIFTHPDARMS